MSDSIPYEGSWSMLAFAAAILFAIAFVLNATETSTDAVFSPTSLALVGLALLAAHMGGAGTGWGSRRRRR
ncbi:hypothetical protein [Streptomyces tsukubensis]|uniref:Uncharacterized protein n=1 Tax=Streptomyces tsukubensis TaxID=83656 RepID=A0A1V3ZYY6_9ACTN|nr:hypothetical protein [Streptomyces tsukubensis]OON71355.1 hypothetical protein B1H18_34130 [Streptomyces tsukubensis]QFR92335.1 hypothetical protein GBW32_03790 [Streptomyces tsukubensis]